MTYQAQSTMNTWELNAINYQFPEKGSLNPDGSATTSASTWRRVQDPVICPGLYAPSGIDVMALLLRVRNRPNPQVDLGPVDCSVVLVICDMLQPDAPIIYVSQSFSELTGYSCREAIGRNCRFLQVPPSRRQNKSSRERSSASASTSSSKKRSESSTIRRIRHAVYSGQEIQTPVTNYKKNGQSFKNLLTIIPVPVSSDGNQYCVGLLRDID